MRLWLRLHTQLHRAKDLIYLHQQITREHRETNRTPNPRDPPIATSHGPSTTRYQRITSQTHSLRLKEVTDLADLNESLEDLSPWSRSELDRSIFHQTDRSTHKLMDPHSDLTKRREEETEEHHRRRSEKREREREKERKF